MIKALEEQNALILEFMHQTQGLTEERRVAILASFCGNTQLAHCVQLQQNQDGSPSPAYWRDYKILRPKNIPEETHITLKMHKHLANPLLLILILFREKLVKKSGGYTAEKKDWIIGILGHTILILRNAGAQVDEDSRTRRRR